MIDHYLLVNIGWLEDRRIHNPLIHIDLIEVNVWIQNDDTEDGIANDLVRAGIPQDRIVLGFHEPDVRKYREFAGA